MGNKTACIGKRKNVGFVCLGVLFLVAIVLRYQEPPSLVKISDVYLSAPNMEPCTTVKIDVPVSSNRTWSWDKGTHVNLVENAEPWMSVQVRSLITSYLHEHTVMLEYGGGGSTLFFASRVRQLFTVESVAEFVERLKAQIFERGDHNVRLTHAAPNAYYDLKKLKPSLTGHKYAEEMMKADIVDKDSLRWWLHNGGPQGIKLPPPPTWLKPRYHKFKGDYLHNSEYVHAPDDFGVQQFDIVLIDGVARGACLFYILDFITEKSRVFVHDFFNAESSEQWDRKFNLLGIRKYYNVVAKIEELSPYVSGGTVVVLQKKSPAELGHGRAQLTKFELDRLNHRRKDGYAEFF